MGSIAQASPVTALARRPGYDGRVRNQPTRLDQLAALWRRTLRRPIQRLLWVSLLSLFLWCAHLARAGTSLARIGVALIVLLVLLTLALVWRAERRRWASVSGKIAGVIGPTDAELGGRALRAFRLLERTERDASAGSPTLAALHYERLVLRVSDQAVQTRAGLRARTLGRFGWLSLAIAVAALIRGPFRVFEGTDVLFARNGLAPIPVSWLEITRVSAQPPAYLRAPEHALYVGYDSQLPTGTVVTVRGVPLRDGRELVLSDGKTQTGFVSDGAGGLVARWTLKQSTELWVGARFGDVLILEPEALPLVAVADSAPKVVLEGAPKTVPLRDLNRLDLHYDASDDHGLRQVDLVLRTGGHEERRVLSKLDGERDTDRGGYALRAADPFLRRAFLPVTVSIEARDNDPVDGPKWGKSAAITLEPSMVGEPEALRYRALTGARDAMVDVLAAELSGDKTAGLIQTANASMQSAVDGGHGGKPTPGGVKSFLLGQARLLAGPTPPGSSRSRKVEDVVLAVDVVLRQLGIRDAQSSAKRLGDVAEELADGAKQARETERRDLGLARVDAALRAVEGGGRQLLELGVLGNDLGNVTLSELGRIRRARSEMDLLHTELAARHLAERLRRPTPSFGGGGRGGVESGGSGSGTGSGAGNKPSAESEAADRFNQLASELEQLASEHASEIERVERALNDAEKSVDMSELKDEARRRADAVRDAVQDLPSLAGEPGSPRASAAAAREHGSAMAQAMERLDLREAVQSGRGAVSALDEAARRIAGQGRAEGTEELKETRQKLSEQLSWAEKTLEEAERKAQARAQSSLDQSGSREDRMADRTGNLAGRGKDGEAALPEDMVGSLERAENLMRDAARELVSGKGDEGLRLQRQAQQLLEETAVGKTTDDEAEARNADQDGSGKGMRTDGDVPKRDDSRSAEEFRRRVLEGLGRARGGKLAPAVKRYAEGLLR